MVGVFLTRRPRPSPCQSRESGRQRTRTPVIRWPVIPVTLVTGCAYGALDDGGKPADAISRLSKWAKRVWTAAIEICTRYRCVNPGRNGLGGPCRHVCRSVDSSVACDNGGNFASDRLTNAFSRGASWDSGGHDGEFVSSYGPSEPFYIKAFVCLCRCYRRVCGAPRSRSVFARCTAFRIARNHNSVSPST